MDREFSSSFRYGRYSYDCNSEAYRASQDTAVHRALYDKIGSYRDTMRSEMACASSLSERKVRPIYTLDSSKRSSFNYGSDNQSHNFRNSISENHIKRSYSEKKYLDIINARPYSQIDRLLANRGSSVDNHSTSLQNSFREASHPKPCQSFYPSKHLSHSQIRHIPTPPEFNQPTPVTIKKMSREGSSSQRTEYGKKYAQWEKENAVGWAKNNYSSAQKNTIDRLPISKATSTSTMQDYTNLSQQQKTHIERIKRRNQETDRLKKEANITYESQRKADLAKERARENINQQAKNIDRLADQSLQRGKGIADQKVKQHQQLQASMKVFDKTMQKTSKNIPEVEQAKTNFSTSKKESLGQFQQNQEDFNQGIENDERFAKNLERSHSTYSLLSEMRLQGYHRTLERITARRDRMREKGSLPPNSLYAKLPPLPDSLKDIFEENKGYYGPAFKTATNSAQASGITRFNPAPISGKSNITPHKEAPTRITTTKLSNIKDYVIAGATIFKDGCQIAAESRGRDDGTYETQQEKQASMERQNQALERCEKNFKEIKNREYVTKFKAAVQDPGSFLYKKEVEIISEDNISGGVFYKIKGDPLTIKSKPASIIYINGMLNSKFDSQETAGMVSKFTGDHETYGIYFKLTGEVVPVKLGIAEAEIKFVEKSLKDLAADSEQVILINHSLGVEIGDQALHRLERQQKDKIHVHAFGGATIISNEQGAETHNYISNRDLIPILCEFERVEVAKAANGLDGAQRDEALLNMARRKVGLTDPTESIIDFSGAIAERTVEQKFAELKRLDQLNISDNMKILSDSGFTHSISSDTYKNELKKVIDNTLVGSN